MSNIQQRFEVSQNNDRNAFLESVKAINQSINRGFI